MEQMLTRRALEDLFWRVTAEMLGLAPDSKDAVSAKAVRHSWPTDGAPDWAHDEDVCFLRIAPKAAHAYTLRDTRVGEHVDEIRREFITDYSRIHEVSWILYGPSSWERAERIWHRLTLPDIKYRLGHENLFLASDVPFVARVPEHVKGRWWERCDLRAHFYEAARRVGDVSTLADADIRVTRETDA